MIYGSIYVVFQIDQQKSCLLLTITLAVIDCDFESLIYPVDILNECFIKGINFESFC